MRGAYLEISKYKRGFAAVSFSLVRDRFFMQIFMKTKGLSFTTEAFKLMEVERIELSSLEVRTELLLRA